MVKEGYVDLEQDDYREGSLLHRFGSSSSEMTHRTLRPEVKK
jgi:hypothetical protein